MISRRDILVGSGSGLAALTIVAASHAAATMSLPASSGPSLFLVDTALPGAQGAIAAAARAGVPVSRFAGDVGTPWLETLEPMWRREKLPVAGVTYAGGFFCLERLARACGLACVFRAAVPGVDERALFDAATLALAAPRPPGATQSEAGDRALAWVLRPAAKRPTGSR